MKFMTITVLCCGALLAACDDAADKTETMNKAGTELMQSAEKAGDQALETVKDAGDKLAETGTEIKDKAVETTDAAVAASQEAVDDAVAATEKAAAPVIETVKQKVAAVSGDDHEQGEAIYKKHCVACHGSGIAGSPKLGDKTAWKARIAQGEATLIQHAMEGYKGDTGYMPPKGGAMSLSEAEISQAVKYMASKAR